MKRTFTFCLFLLAIFHLKSQPYLTEVDNDNNRYKIYEIDLDTKELTFVGNTFQFESYYELGDIYYDSKNNQLVGLHNSQDLWIYDLSTNTDRIVDLGTTNYRSFDPFNGKAYLMYADQDNNRYEIYVLDLATQVLTHIGQSYQFESYYELDNIYYDIKNNQLVGLHNRRDLWLYNLNTNTDEIIDLGTRDYRSFKVNSPSLLTSIKENYNKKDTEIIKIYDLMGQELPELPLNTTAIIVYSDGSREKVCRIE